MLLPQLESNLKYNIMVLGSDIIKLLKKHKDFVYIETIMNKFLEGDKKRTPDHFINALTFLYSLNSVEYRGYKVRLVKNG